MAMATRRQLSHADYTVGCICPLGIELTTAMGMLDETHNHLPLRLDHNTYKLGRIGDHNVVMAVLPETGNNAAASVARQMLNDFPSIRFSLLVGIGGGVPGKADIRLGDVVVSQPTGTFGGVVQFDLGRRLQNIGFQRTGQLFKPPPLLSTSVRDLEAQRLLAGSKMIDYFETMMQRHQALRTQCSPPSKDSDQLFLATYQHHPGINCDQCDPQQTVSRPLRTPDGPRIHLGTIGSANIVVKDATIRDELEREFNILCVDMEAAGLMNDFPCLVIRGISDYADSHKNKQWQPYAAAMAAAYMKELLLNIPPQQVEHINRTLQAYDTGSQDAGSAKASLKALHFDGMNTRVEQLSLPSLPLESFDWIWSTSFKKWLNGSSPFYWITGKPGSGKSTLMNDLIKNPKTKENLSSWQDKYIIIHFFFDYRAGSSMANNEYGLIKSILAQLCANNRDAEKKVIRQNTHQSIEGASSNQLLDLVFNILESLPSAICAFVDGLDEYKGDYTELAQLLIKIQRRSSMKICLASRPESAFQRHFQQYPSLRMQDHNAASIRLYIDHAIDCAKDKLINVDSVIDNQMREELLDHAKGVIIWARLAVDDLVRVAMTNPSKDHLRSIVERLPDDLETMYESAFDRIPEHSTSEAALLLFFINELGGKVHLKVLHGICHFFESDDTIPRLSMDEDSFLARLTNLLGSFIDKVDLKKPPGRTMKAFRSEKKQKQKLDVNFVEVRLMHKTLQPYLQYSTKVKACLPEVINMKYPDNFRSKFYADVIVAATNLQDFDLDALNPLRKGFTQTMTGSRYYYHGKLLRVSSYSRLSQFLKNDIWSPRLKLLEECISKFPQAAHEQYHISVEIYASWKDVLTSPFMFLELWTRLDIYEARDAYSKYRGYVDLRLAVEYGLPAYLQQAFQHGDWPPPTVWNALMFESLHVLWEPPIWDWNQYHFNPSLSSMQEVSNLIMPYCDAISVDLLALALKRRERYLVNDGEKVEIMYQLLLSMMKTLPVDQNVENSYTICKCKGLEHLLQRVILIDDDISDRLEIDRLEALVIHIIIKENEGAVNRVCEQHGTVLHFLVSQQRWEPFLDSYVKKEWRPSVSALVLLAKLGVDPNVKHLGRTPLQQLNQFRRKIFLNVRAWSGRKATLRKVLSLMAEILQHHQKYGSWPDFTAIVKQWDLKGAALWEVDDSGQIVCDDFGRQLWIQEEMLDNIDMTSPIIPAPSISMDLSWTPENFFYSEAQNPEDS